MEGVLSHDNRLFFLIFFLLGARGSSSSSSSAADDLHVLRETCKKCSQNDANVEYNFCVTSLQADSASRCADLGGLGKIALRLAQKNVTQTRRRIRQLLQTRRRKDPFVKLCLEDCLQLYADSVGTLMQAMRDLEHRRLDDANIEVSSVMDASVSCEDGFHEKDGVASPLTKNNDDAVGLSAISLSIITMLASSE